MQKATNCPLCNNGLIITDTKTNEAQCKLRHKWTLIGDKAYPATLVVGKQRNDGKYVYKIYDDNLYHNEHDMLSYLKNITLVITDKNTIVGLTPDAFQEYKDTGKIEKNGHFWHEVENNIEEDYGIAAMAKKLTSMGLEVSRKGKFIEVAAKK